MMLPRAPLLFILRNLDSLSRIATRCVKHRVESGVTRDDMLERLIEGLREKEGGRVSQADVVTEAMLLLTAGADTTANSLTAIIYYILVNPNVLAKVLQELKTLNAGVAEVDGTLPSTQEDNSAQALETTTDSLPLHDQVKMLPYLNAAIEEGLRMFATNAFGLPRVTGPTGFEFDGVVVPPGVEVSAPAYTIQRDPRIWGADADTYRPERWLEEGGGGLKRHLLTFGSGPRACIGKKYVLSYVRVRLREC